MTDPAVPVREIAEILKRLAETRHMLNDIRQRVERIDSPLAYVAAAQLQLVSTALDEGLLRLSRVARLVVSVIDDEAPRS